MIKYRQGEVKVAIKMFFGSWNQVENLAMIELASLKLDFYCLVRVTNKKT